MKIDTSLRRLRKAAGLTQQQLAGKAGVHLTQIAKIECGEAKIENTSLKTSLALADALGVDPHALLEDTPEDV